jgi:hypothetical protein
VGFSSIGPAIVKRGSPVYDKPVFRPRYCFRVGIRALLTNGDFSLNVDCFRVQAIQEVGGCKRVSLYYYANSGLSP